MANPFVFSWLWRGLRGNSVTFALLFASFAVGLSLADFVKHMLARLGVHWLFILVLPVVFFGWLAKREARFMPDEQMRKWWARGLIVGSLALALLIHWLRKG